jgi:exopolyphosphatase
LFCTWSSCADGLADLDSICSTLLYAYFQSNVGDFGARPNTLHIPLANIDRADLSLRPELKPVLSRVHIKPNELITLSDLPTWHAQNSTTYYLSPEKTQFILIDHNSLTGTLESRYRNRQFGCIDHHDDEGIIPPGSTPCIIRTAGSCASLVIEHCNERWNHLLMPKTNVIDNVIRWNAELAWLALAPIVIDTTNLKNESKTTQTDIDSVKICEQRIPDAFLYNREKYFKELTSAKEDLDGMSLEDILRKDYKEFDENGLKLGMASTVKSLQYLEDKATNGQTFLKEVENFAKTRDLAVVAVMTAFSDDSGKFARELLVWGFGDDGTKSAKKFCGDNTDALGLKMGSKGHWNKDENSTWLGVWDQEKVANSRKQVAPMLRRALKESS